MSQTYEDGVYVNTDTATKEEFLDVCLRLGKALHEQRDKLHPDFAAQIHDFLTEEEYEDTLDVRTAFFEHIYHLCKASPGHFFANVIFTVPSQEELATAISKSTVDQPYSLILRDGTNVGNQVALDKNQQFNGEPMAVYEGLMGEFDDTFYERNLITMASPKVNRAENYFLAATPTSPDEQGRKRYHALVSVGGCRYDKLGQYEGTACKKPVFARLMMVQWLWINHIYGLEENLSTKKKSYFGHLVACGQVKGHPLLDSTFYASRKIHSRFIDENIAWLENSFSYMLKESLKHNDGLFMTPTTLTD